MALAAKPRTLKNGLRHLFGTTSGGGLTFVDKGTVFEVAKDGSSYATTPTILATFDGTNRAQPNDLIMDAAGNLFGTTENGGSSNEGTVFELPFTGTGSTGYGTVITLATFNGTNGSQPLAGVTANGAGALFGTTDFGGTSNNGTVFEVTDSGFVTCFLRGTRIATPSGQVPIEQLQEGDLVLTESGQRERIKWIGRRAANCETHPNPKQVWPIRIHAHAFGPNIPERDLLLSPQHAIFAEDVLIPAKCLVNGRNVTVEQTSRVEYFHIELNQHDVILAEGLPAETYLENGARSNFDNAGCPMRLHPDFSFITWESQGYAPLVVTGPEVESVRELLDRRKGEPARAA